MIEYIALAALAAVAALDTVWMARAQKYIRKLEAQVAKGRGDDRG